MKEEMNSGFIFLHRKMLEWEWYDSPTTKIVFLHLLLMANFKPNQWHGKNIPRGAIVTSTSAIAESNGLSVQQVRTSLDRLKATGEITVESTNKYSIITVTNYDNYQITTPGKVPKKTKQKPKEQNEQLTLSQIDYQGIVDLYHSICVKRPKIQVLNDKRKTLIKKADSVLAGDFKKLFDKVAASEFLNRKSSKWCDLEWILTPSHIANILEGKYDGWDNKNNVPTLDDYKEGF